LIDSSQRRRCKPVVAACLSCLLVAACSTPPPPNAFEEAFDDDTKPWQEIQTQLPAAPKEGDLVSFQVSGATQYRFALDAKSIDIGSDGVFRYTIVAISPEGARNVSYEGIRCLTSEKKIYAIGRSDGSWSRSRSAAWKRIQDVSLNRQDAALEDEYFCPGGYAARSRAEIVARMHPRLAPSETTFDDQTRNGDR